MPILAPIFAVAGAGDAGADEFRCHHRQFGFIVFDPQVVDDVGMKVAGEYDRIAHFRVVQETNQQLAFRWVSRPAIGVLPTL
jgi:hypothetical protein